jgi:hypothetical protein
MMEYEFRVIVEKVSVTSQQVVKRETVKIYDITQPQSILDLGLRHGEQISLLSKVQSALLVEQSALIDVGIDACPKCGQKMSKHGFTQSNFHAVFSDHQLRIQKHRCKNPECHWQSAPTTTSVFGTAIHPDLVKLQCEQGALHSYRDAAGNLERMNAQRRRINNHDRVKIMTNQLGAQVAQENLKVPSAEELPVPAEVLIVQVDGGHIPIKDKDKRSFEALSGVVYRPSSIEVIDQHHRRISEKSCVISAREDQLQTIETYLYHAALKQGLTEQTQVTALADGASNCWRVILALEPHCLTLELILDWFHIGKKFQNVKNALGKAFTESLDSAKWTLWHGDAEAALLKIALMRDNITDEKTRSKLTGLHDYLKNNQDYLVNYDEREKANKTFTSQVAESHIDSLINARHKQKQKMQWTREGAHNVLQIRASMASNEWDERWLEYVMSSLEKAA